MAHIRRKYLCVWCCKSFELQRKRVGLASHTEAFQTRFCYDLCSALFLLGLGHILKFSRHMKQISYCTWMEQFKQLIPNGDIKSKCSYLRIQAFFRLTRKLRCCWKTKRDCDATVTSPSPFLLDFHERLLYAWRPEWPFPVESHPGRIKRGKKIALRRDVTVAW